MTSFQRARESPATSSLATSSPFLSIAASPSQLQIVCDLVRTVAIAHKPTLDDLADLILAVHEAANTLINHALPASTLTCTFDDDTEHSLRVVLTATTPAPIDTSTTSFGWLVLQTLVDDVVLEQIPRIVDQNWAVMIILDKALQAGS